MLPHRKSWSQPILEMLSAAARHFPPELLYLSGDVISALFHLTSLRVQSSLKRRSLPKQSDDNATKSRARTAQKK
jgi:hypothetical protein